MFISILKMSAVTALYVLLTMFLWYKLGRKPLSVMQKLQVGFVYGVCSILSTHFGIDLGGMVVNVRDIGPLAAGLFFDPFSGILAGLIGGIERYIAGTYWGIGSFTRIACSVSTCLAGFLAAFLRIKVFKHKKPSATYAFFMGAVMEVFHMYVVFITHRDDMEMAYRVVQTCSLPMIIFTGLGMAASATGLRILAGEWRNPFRRLPDEDVPVSHRFQVWLFSVSMAILLVNFLFSFAIQTQNAIQSARDSLLAVSSDISQTYDSIQQTQDGVEDYAESVAATDAQVCASTIKTAGGPDAVDADFLEQMRAIWGLESVYLLDGQGQAVLTAGSGPVYAAMLSDVLDGSAEIVTAQPTSARIVSGARCGDYTVQVVINPLSLMASMQMSGLNDALSYFHVGNTGTFDIIRNPGVIAFGSHSDIMLATKDRDAISDAPRDTFFTKKLFGVKSLCRVQQLDDDTVLLVALPVTEVYANRNTKSYEDGMADILLFTVIYMLISLLVQQIVVRNLDLVNASLSKITNGDLNEVVSVRNSSEFASLSDDINQTVQVLKGYISAAEKRIEQELELARVIQASALPRNFNFSRKDFELFALMDPAKEVGGDFYDFFLIGQNRLALVIADVSGKGIPAALFMMRGKTAIRSLAETGSSPSEILFKANNALCEGNDAEMFITAWIGIIDLGTGTMVCASAGHEYPALMRADGGFELFRDKHGLTLGSYEDMRYKEYELPFKPGDKLFVYTDGVPEAIDEQFQQYGTDRMLDELNDVKDRAMADILPAVRADISAFVGKADQFDDITMLGFAYYGDGAQPEKNG